MNVYMKTNMNFNINMNMNMINLSLCADSRRRRAGTCLGCTEPSSRWTFPRDEAPCTQIKI